MVFLKSPTYTFYFLCVSCLGNCGRFACESTSSRSLIGRFAKVLGHFTKVSFSLVFFEVFNCPNTLAKRPETSANWLLAKRPVTVLRDREGVRRHRLPFGIDYHSASITVWHGLSFGVDYRSVFWHRLSFGIDCRSVFRHRLPFATIFRLTLLFALPQK